MLEDTEDRNVPFASMKPKAVRTYCPYCFSQIFAKFQNVGDIRRVCFEGGPCHPCSPVKPFLSRLEIFLSASFVLIGSDFAYNS